MNVPDLVIIDELLRNEYLVSVKAGILVYSGKPYLDISR